MFADVLGRLDEALDRVQHVLRGIDLQQVDIHFEESRSDRAGPYSVLLIATSSPFSNR